MQKIKSRIIPDVVKPESFSSDAESSNKDPSVSETLWLKLAQHHMKKTCNSWISASQVYCRPVPTVQAEDPDNEMVKPVCWGWSIKKKVFISYFCSHEGRLQYCVWSWWGGRFFLDGCGRRFHGELVSNFIIHRYYRLQHFYLILHILSFLGKSFLSRTNRWCWRSRPWKGKNQWNLL